jgi:hypothetical protein
MAARIDDSLDALLSAHRGATRPAYAIAGLVWNDSDNDQLYLFDGTADYQIAVNVGAPASASAAGVAGDVAWDSDYFYVCTAANTWKRVAIATW